MAYQKSKHQQKYDRQMRLWGGHGQKNIEECHVCVLGGGPTATESLKNLVLPNIGEFTVVDDQLVTVSDLGNNFFCKQEDLGKSRAESIKENMLEMNAVKGHHVQDSPSNVINGDASFFDQFQLIVASNVYGDDFLKLADLAQQKSTPLLSVRANGYVGSLRVISPDLCVIESHPDDMRIDICLFPDQIENFPELKEFLFGFDLSTMDEDIPAPAIIAQCVQQWKDAHDGKIPTTFSEKDEFVDSSFGGKQNYENYQEAKKHGSLGYLKPRVGPMVESILTNPLGENITANSNIFWIMIRGLRDFMENEGSGFLPVTTKIPDFHTTSENYMTLKGLYKARAERDRVLVVNYVRTRMNEVGKDNELLDESFISLFVKHCRDLHFDQFRSVADEYNTPNMEEIHECFDEFDMSMLTAEGAPQIMKPKLINWYLAMRLLDNFHQVNGRVPGLTDETLESDKSSFREITEAWLKEMNFEREYQYECLDELCRFGGSEMHPVSAVMGGVCSQAALKIILKQYFPFNHTFVYDGIHCQGQVFKI